MIKAVSNFRILRRTLESYLDTSVFQHYHSQPFNIVEFGKLTALNSVEQSSIIIKHSYNKVVF